MTIEDLCAYCARPFGSFTDDHVFPRSWYPDTTPENMEKWQVPCCFRCNQEKSRLEEYALTYLLCCADPTSAEARGLITKTLRRFDPAQARSEKDRRCREREAERFKSALHRRTSINESKLFYFSKGKTGDYVISIDWVRISRLMEMIVRGIHCYIEKVPLPASAHVKCHPLKNHDVLVELRPVVQAGEFHELGPGMRFRRADVKEGSEQRSLYGLLIWGAADFWVTVHAAGIPAQAAHALRDQQSV